MTWLALLPKLYMAACAALVTGALFGLIFCPLVISGRHSEAEREQEREREYRDWKNRTGRWART